MRGIEGSSRAPLPQHVIDALHHAFRLTDGASGRVLDGTLPIHTRELPKYNISLSDEKELTAMGLEQLDALTAGLQEKLRGRVPS